ncbi:MAG: benzoyl-CoA reductase [Elusimicrobia bacterium RIFOXYC2_FULL_34_12]|nr:MAG: benzoyl-CoA reductase [Elusimicrobia bacterium RIFOXYC2_FULL_34_12]
MLTGDVAVVAETKEDNNELWRWKESRWTNPDIDWRAGSIISAGIDVGSVSTQCVIMVDGELYAYASLRSGSGSADSAWKGTNKALEGTGMTVDNWDYCVGTGYGRVLIPMSKRAITEIACHGRGANWMYGPRIRTILDMGGQDCKVIRIDERGKLLNFVMNDKCAAGAGRGMEVFADFVGVPIIEVGERSFDIDDEPKPVSSTCVIFAKSEAAGLLREGWDVNKVLAAYCSATASRVMELMKRVGLEPELAITGGIAKNRGVSERIEKQCGMKFIPKKWHNPEYEQKSVPFDTQIAGAVGAALFARALKEKEKGK